MAIAKTEQDRAKLVIWIADLAVSVVQLLKMPASERSENSRDALGW